VSDDHTIEVGPGEHSTIQELVASYLRAVERFRAEDSLAGPGDHQLANESRGRSALAEALNWADAIDNYLSAGPKDTERDPAWVEKLPDADQQLLRAFQRVRNVIHHRWWEAVALRLSLSGDRQSTPGFGATSQPQVAAAKVAIRKGMPTTHPDWRDIE